MHEIGFHQVIAASLIPTLTTFLQVKYQSQNPFDTHAATMLAAVSSVMVYFLLYLAVLRYPELSRFAVVTQHLMVWFAYAAFSTLASALFPERASLFIYVIFGLLLAGEVLYMFRDKLRIIEVDAESVLVFLNNRWGDVISFFVRRRRPKDPILPIQNS